MATVYIIAGPPGIGKSTSGRDFIPEGMDILDADLIIHRYRQEGLSDYWEVGNRVYEYLLHRALVSRKDFALELNLGFQSHYDHLIKVKSYSLSNRIEVVLFHTDDLQLCLDRARIRHENGLHLVEPETVREMYRNTIPLLKKNMGLVSALSCVDVKRAGPGKRACLEFDSLKGILRVKGPIAGWIDGELMGLLRAVAQERNIGQSMKTDTKIGRRPKEKRGRGM